MRWLRNCRSTVRCRIASSFAVMTSVFTTATTRSSWRGPDDTCDGADAAGDCADGARGCANGACDCTDAANSSAAMAEIRRRGRLIRIRRIGKA